MCYQNDTELTISLPSDVLELIDEDDSFFCPALMEFLDSEVESIEPYLEKYFNEGREEFSPDGTEVGDCSRKKGSRTEGIVYINYTGYVHMACRDLSGPTDHSDGFSFMIDRETQAISINFPNPAYPEPDYY